MRNLIVLCLLSVAFFSDCKKIKETTNPEVWCITAKNINNGSITKEGCVDSKEAAKQKVIELRDQGKDGSYVQKTKCSDC